MVMTGSRGKGFLLAFALCVGLAATAPTSSGAALARNGRIGFSSDGSLFSIREGGLGKRLLATGYGSFGTTDWSPDGRWIAFPRDTTPSNTDIWIVRADGTGLRRITRSPATDIWPSFAPDGRRIAFSSNRSGRAHIYTIRFDGTHLRQITSGLQDEDTPAWSPRGDELAYTSITGLVGDLVVKNLRTGDVRTLYDPSSAEAYAPSWSPDGARIAFTIASGGCTLDDFNHFSIGIVNADGTGGRFSDSSAWSDSRPVWSPDGKKLVFVRRKESCDSFLPPDIWVMHADFTNRFQVTNTPVWEDDPSWQPRP